MDLFEYAQTHAGDEAEGEKPVEAAIFTVAEITAEVKGHIVSRFGRENFWVKGEISNYKGRNQSGHMYFRLKDDRAVLNCVFFRNANRHLDVELSEGLDVLALGRIDVWERGGNYQLIVEEVRPGGAGELYLRFEMLKKKLEAEGLFAPARKRPLPAFPRRIGLVTSPTGAVLRDIIHVIGRRAPSVALLLLPVKVQGEGAAQEIAQAIGELNRPEYALDLLIVGRGGGSIEDLWAFNEEVVARALAASRVPTISAVGHQTDFTIADFVADRRAATPSNAAELAVPDMVKEERELALLIRNVVRELLRARQVASERLASLRRAAPLRDPRSLIRERAQRLDLAVERMTGSLVGIRDRRADRVIRALEHLRLAPPRLLDRRRLRFQKASSNLDLLSPLGVLARGYGIVSRKDGAIVRESGQVNAGDDVSVRLHKGALQCRVTRTSNS